jgi:hypothetical protein
MRLNIPHLKSAGDVEFGQLYANTGMSKCRAGRGCAHVRRDSPGRGVSATGLRGAWATTLKQQNFLPRLRQTVSGDYPARTSTNDDVVVRCIGYKEPLGPRHNETNPHVLRTAQMGTRVYSAREMCMADSAEYRSELARRSANHIHTLYTSAVHGGRYLFQRVGVLGCSHQLGLRDQFVGPPWG